MWLRSKASISIGSAKLVANVILQNQEKERNNDNGCLLSLSHPLAIGLKENQKMTTMMNMLSAIIVVHLATNIIAKEEKNKDDEHAIMHIIVLVINMHKKKN
jgi:hypothetical protein